LYSLPYSFLKLIYQT